MPVFRCLIRGENFPGSLAGETEPVGFYATRFVEAPSRSQVEPAALAILWGDSAFDSVPAQDRTDAKIYFDEIEQMLEKPQVRSPGKDFTFFGMSTQVLLRMSDQELAQLDALYWQRGADGHPDAWGQLVNRLRSIRRSIEAGKGVSVHEGLELKSVREFHAWAYRHFKALEDGYDSWIGDDQS